MFLLVLAYLGSPGQRPVKHKFRCSPIRVEVGVNATPGEAVACVLVKSTGSITAVRQLIYSISCCVCVLWLGSGRRRVTSVNCCTS